jgi:hypothetical protein
MRDLATLLLGAPAAIVVAIGWISGLLLVVWMPYMAWSVTRNIRHIRIQLERLNNTLESRTEGPRAGTLGL